MTTCWEILFTNFITILLKYATLDVAMCVYDMCVIFLRNLFCTFLNGYRATSSACVHSFMNINIFTWIVSLVDKGTKVIDICFLIAGAIFEQGTDEVQSAFKFAMFNHNQNTTTRKFELQAFVDVINTADAYKLSRLSKYELHISVKLMDHVCR